MPTTLSQRLYLRALRFLRTEMWRPVEGGARALLIGFVRRVLLTTRLFLREGLPVRASALTYSTLMAIVPLLAIVFAIAKGFGLSEIIETNLREQLAAQPAVADTLVGFVHSYLDHTRGGVFLGFGLFLLLWTLINLTRSIESTFNAVWQVERERTLIRQITDYTAVFFLLPVFLLASGGLTVFANSSLNALLVDTAIMRPALLTLVRIIPLAIVCLFFTALYFFMPNTRVRFRSALAAGIPVGIVFQLLQWGYVYAQVWLSGYNAIYGSFAALPLLMLLMQISWMVCLFGAALCYVDQNLGTYYFGRDEVHTSRAEHDYLCLLLASLVCQRFHAGEEALDADRLARLARVHIRHATTVLHRLVRVGILCEAAREQHTETTVYLPARDIHALTAAALFSALDREGASVDELRPRTSFRLYLQRRSVMLSSGFPNVPLHDLFATLTASTT